MAKYEVTIYNAAVRKKVEAGERHPRFTDDWADFHYVEVTAADAEQARAQAEARHPPDQGFVIDNIQPIQSKYE